MAYTEFTLDTIPDRLHLTIQQTALFPTATPISPPNWLPEALERGLPLALVSEKARSEFIIAPILLALRELSHNRVAVYSGQRLDSDPQLGLVGECDFIITNTPPLPIIQSPIISLVEAKKNDIENGLGQCAAQMLGAQLFNARHANQVETIYGCTTTGEVWQFLKLAGSTLTIDSDRYYINELNTIMGILYAMVVQYIHNGG